MYKQYLFSMKYACVVLLLVSSGCKKEQPSPADKLYGDWQWMRSIGGLTGKQVEKPPVGSKYLFRFTHDGYWSQCYNGKCGDPTPFTLQQEKSRLFGNEQLVLTLRRKVYLAPPDTGYHILLDRYLVQEISDSLRIDQDYPDGFGSTYSRK